MKSDWYLSFVIMFQMVAVVFQQLLPMFGIVTVEQSATLRIVVTLIIYTPALFILFKRQKALLFITFLGYSIFLLFNYAFFPESQTFIESRDAITLTPIAILTILFVICVIDFSIFFKSLLWLGRFMPIVGALYIWGARNSPFIAEFTYSMSFGYAVLLPTLYLFIQKNLIDKATSLVLFLMVILAGSRGPIVVTSIFYLYFLLFFSYGKAKLISIVVIISIGFLSIFYISNSEYAENSRNIYLITSGEVISHDSGREDIHKIIENKIMERPILGWGVGADRKFVGGYSHSIFLEVMVHYGIIGGGLFFIFLFVYNLKLFFDPQVLDKQGGRLFFIMMFLFGFVPMLVSGSYLYAYGFALWLGFLFRFYAAKKHMFKIKI